MSLAKLARTALLVSAASSLEIGRGPTASDADAPSPPEQCECDGGAPKWISEDVVEDVRARRGFFDARLEIRDGQYGRGIFTTADIAAQELLIALPFDLILSDDDDDGSPCGTINLLRRELELGRCSDHWPWLKSVHETLLPSPGSWSAEELAELDGLPPGNWRDQQELYQHHCATSRDDVFDPLLVRALFLFATRSTVFGFFPVFDLLNHGYNSTVHKETAAPKLPTVREASGGEASGREASGGEASGVEARSHSHGRRAAVYAQFAIPSGSELATAYRPGPGFGRARWEQYSDDAAAAGSGDLEGTPEIFRAYGFVESKPQHWWFELNASRHAFVLEADGSVYWHRRPDAAGLGSFAAAARAFLDEQTTRRRRHQQLSSAVNVGDPGRRALAHSYREALLGAVELAQRAAEAELQPA